MKAIPVIVENPSALKAKATPVAVGVPFERGTLKDASKLKLADKGGSPVPLQAQCLAKWPDGSARWVLLDFPATVAAAKSSAYKLAVGGKAAKATSPVTAKKDARGVTLSNGLVTFRVAKGGTSSLLASADGKASAEILALVELGEGKKRTTSQTIIDSLEIYAAGPVRAAVDIKGRRLYSDGMEGPWSQRVEMFAGSPYVRVEDTFIYAHFPGSHAKPQNPLALWKLEAHASGQANRLDVVSLMPEEEAEGLVVDDTSVAFWGSDKPFDLSRHTDKELVGEDTPGIALGLGKSAAALFGLVGVGAEAAGALGRLWAHTTPEVYAASGALGDFAPVVKGKFKEAEEGLKQFLGFWMWYQDNDPDGSFGKGPWHGIFDWGDWQTRFANRKHQPTGWNYYEGRYGWDCNEMDSTLMLWSIFFHNARPEYWRVATAMSRHMMDVDMLNVDYRKYKLPKYVYDPHSYGAPWKEGQDRLMKMNTIGLGRRHNVQHWGNGVGDTRHTWNGGVMMYYYATGNRRAYDAVISMAEMHMQRIWGYAAGEYTLSLWCLYNAWQMTGSKRYRTELDYRIGVVHKLRLPDGGIPGHLDFDKKKTMLAKDEKHGEYLDLTLDYFTNALIDYYADTRDEKSRQLLMGLAERNMQDTPTGPADFQRIDAMRLLAWAYRETGDKSFLERAAYHLSSFNAKPLAKWPSSPKDWRKTFGLLGPHDWDIRSGGPGVRMAPYVMNALLEAKKAKK